EVSEHPASEFVAGFVGVSNLLERGERRFTVRPEKIRILEDDEPPAPGDQTEAGAIRDVVYVGAVTRFVVELDQGGTLMVVSQNVDGFAARAVDEQGRRAVLAWRPENTFTIDSSDKEVVE